MDIYSLCNLLTPIKEFTSTVVTHVFVLLSRSIAVQVMLVIPNGKDSPSSVAKLLKSFERVTAPQLSAHKEGANSLPTVE